MALVQTDQAPLCDWETQLSMIAGAYGRILEEEQSRLCENSLARVNASVQSMGEHGTGTWDGTVDAGSWDSYNLGDAAIL